MKLDPANPPADHELVRLMLEVPHLIRRPVIRIGVDTLFGFDQRRLATMLSGA